MNRDELRAAQEPLKARYREDPGAALHPAAGGDGSDACSGDMLMEALVACAGVTLHAVSVAFGVDLREVEVRAEATFDARGTLGVDRTAPVGVLGPRVVAEVTTDADDTTLQRLATATERYCVVGQSLRQPPTIEVRRRAPRDR